MKKIFSLSSYEVRKYSFEKELNCVPFSCELVEERKLGESSCVCSQFEPAAFVYATTKSYFRCFPDVLDGIF